MNNAEENGTKPEPRAFKCQTCREPFTVFPPPKDPSGWDNCLGEQCPSYSVDRDPYAIELMYGIEMEKGT